MVQQQQYLIKMRYMNECTCTNLLLLDAGHVHVLGSLDAK